MPLQGMLLARSAGNFRGNRRRTVLLLIAVYLLLVVVLPLGLSVTISYRALPRLQSCAQCGGETLPVVSRLVRMTARLTSRPPIERRWCFGCGWVGFVRSSGSRPTSARGDEHPATRTVELRSLAVDGLAWTVRLECWRQTGLSYGRLVFVAPSGRLWPDGRPLHGASDAELVDRASSLPDGTLRSRLREVVRD